VWADTGEEMLLVLPHSVKRRHHPEFKEKFAAAYNLQGEVRHGTADRRRARRPRSRQGERIRHAIVGDGQERP
jgi:hypothetical protein